MVAARVRKRVPRDRMLVSAIAARYSIGHRVISAYPYKAVQKSPVLPITSLEALRSEVEC